MNRSRRRLRTLDAVIGIPLVVSVFVRAATTGSVRALVYGLVGCAYLAAVFFTRGEATSWLRDDMDERRAAVARRSYAVAFAVLAAWVVVVDAVEPAQITGSEGVLLALALAWVHYAVALRRT